MGHTISINNKIKLEELHDGGAIISAENEDVSVALIDEGVFDAPESLKRAERIVECYNLFIGVDNPTEYFKSRNL